MMQQLEIRHDYLLHFFWGAVLAFFPVLLLGGWGVIIALVIGLLKEVYDFYSEKGESDVMDIVYTVTPALMFYIVLQK